jgi:hypothetical protein
VGAIRAAAWRRGERERQVATTAWLVAALHRQKTLPPLESLVTAGTKKQAQTPEEQLAFIRTFARAHNRRLNDG